MCLFQALVMPCAEALSLGERAVNKVCAETRLLVLFILVMIP